MSYDNNINRSIEVYQQWKQVPAPKRGELIKTFGEVLTTYKDFLADVMTQEMFKTIREARGEVQEAIDMCTFAAGLSRQLYGLTMPSERPLHRIQEVWQPLGPIGVITAFNFPVAVWAWNFCIAAVCGNTVVWKPSEKAVETAKQVHELWKLACHRASMPQFKDINIVVDADREIGKQMAADERLALISATGSTEMGRSVGQTVASRFGKVILELGGNNAVIVSQHGDLDLAVKGCTFGAVGTTGQRCTTTRRIFVHKSIANQFIEKMVAAYNTIAIGDPQDLNTLMGPLIDQQAFDSMTQTIERVFQYSGCTKVIYGGDRVTFAGDNRFYVKPCIVVTEQHIPPMDQETFAPIVYLMSYDTIEQAIALNNCVPQGLSSAIFTNSVLEAELFLQEAHSGIVNVNTGTSGAEIGGAFGGEKDTGGGRESGSDSWKQYMRRVTSTINYSGTLPLAQGIKFDV